MQRHRGLGVAAALALSAHAAVAQTWTPLKNSPPLSIGYMVLATDGSVLAHARTYSSDDAKWFKLTPDSTGSYVNGTWSQIASMPAGYAPIDTAGGVLADGKVLVEGGEYNEAADVESNLGAIYDPVADTWTSVPPPASWTEIGDASGVILANGTFMMGQQAEIDSALFDEAHLSWTITGTNKPDYNVEENWILLPNSKVLNVETYWWDKYNATGTGSELFDPSTGQWSDAGSTIVQLWDSAANCGGSDKASFEIGPMILRPDGTVLGTGANACAAGHSAIYHTSTGAWTAGPDFPNGLDFADAPAAVETNGKVLMMASPGIYQSPPTFLEWDGTSFTTVASPSTVSSDSSWYGAMLELPSGQILFSDLSTDLQVWTPAGTYQAAWQPTVGSVSSLLTAGSRNNPISGTQFNGMTQGAYYGDDQQMATNYPLVRIVNNASGAVTYCRTHDHSSMGVQTGNAVVSTNFDIPQTIPLGPSTLYVVANGIPSAGVAVNVGAAVPDFSLTATTATVTAGRTGTSTVTETAIGGFNSAVSLTLSGLPSGVTATFSPASISGSGTSTLTFTAASNVVAPGSDPVATSITLTGTSASGSIRTSTFYLMLVAAPAGSMAWNVSTYDFGTLTSIADSYTPYIAFDLTNTGAVPVTVTDVSVVEQAGVFHVDAGSCNGKVAPGAACTAYVYFSPSGQPPGAFTGSLVATDSAADGTQSIALTGTGSATGFNESATSATVAIGSSGTATVTQVVQGGFSAPVTLSAEQLPAGVTVSFSPPTITGAGTSTMTYSVSASATPKSYGVMVIGTSPAAGITQVYTTGLEVTAQSTPTFSLTASSTRIAAGSTGTATVTETISNGFSVPVALSASGLPNGVTASFNPPSIVGAGSSTVTFTAASTTAPGDYPVAITGAPAAGTAQATSLVLSVTNSDVIFANGFEGASGNTPVLLSPASYDFGTVVVNGYSSWQAFTLTNNGSAAIALGAAQVQASSGQFSITSYCGSTLDAGDHCTIWALFAPTSAGTINGMLAIVADGNTLTSPLSGTGASGPAGPHRQKPPVPAPLSGPQRAWHAHGIPDRRWRSHTQ